MHPAQIQPVCSDNEVSKHYMPEESGSGSTRDE